jgi:hypothetical protein
MNPDPTAITGTLTITSGSSAGTISALGTEGCTTTYSVSGNVATAAPAGQTCTVTNNAGGQGVRTNQSHTLTLSSDGASIAEAGTATIVRTDAMGKMTMCTSSSQGTFTKP